MLLIKNLKVNVDNINILNGVNLQIQSGETHVIMGPNGAGKSTLAATLAGRKDCIVTSGSIFFKNKDLLLLEPNERAGAGIFLAFQHPVEIAGIKNQFFLQTAINAVRKYRNQPILERFDANDFIKSKLKLLKMPVDFLNRSINVGFSGGEKKRNDILQMAVLEPSLCILDETDSGLDIDALKIVSNGINTLKNSTRSFIIITHYQRILEHIKPNFVHILYQGCIIKSGDISLAKKLEEKGYGWLA
ncbi:Fe-S cluster assembly ATPase SufC [Blochmannia endosymbiont of Polyrhachis (Hedomyrma) turneri]|uniref:Fe-S cluster assembly ATPase SufC n=1 Tax=Blochmannia endosymbiont of Polyrhachis (Hedomyrma) turneri TaxID=1505596 RepID=UPI00061A8162|nr:Fe-S cluster assembly ATPase SufC [Blochmannia endosymbiont of Polyrhachis (Hedomyrma) turneri]AKC59929.1 putative ATP-dependent transporter SufC [Blochmannia endosymbiont of Polyrhachis (Hedomyrma) turneri]